MRSTPFTSSTNGIPGKVSLTALGAEYAFTVGA
jgi:hypothetical protein